jgi:GNAT superfamily N-acetyltransferase
MVLYSCELPISPAGSPAGVLDRKKNFESVSADEMNRIGSHWNPTATRKLAVQRFAANAELWLLRWNGTIAAYGWTLKGKTVEPHYFPVQPDDVHLFDFFVFPEFRGRNLNPSLVSQILVETGREGCRRALIEAAAWNTAQHSSLAKTPFKKLGVARKFSLGKSTYVTWSKSAKVN